MKISIIIPVYNGANFIKQRFAELTNYNNDEAEVIFINDGSTDESLSILNKCKSTFKGNAKIMVVNIQHNSGCLYAIKFGVELAKYDDILTTDIDDPFSFSYLESLKFELEGSVAKTLITIPKQLFVDGKPNGVVWHVPEYPNPEQYIVSLFVNHSGLVALNNTILKRENIIEARGEAIELLKSIGVSRMDYGEDSLTANILIHNGLVKHIVPSKSYTVPYTYDNNQSQSKDDSKIKRDRPLLIAHAYYCIYSQYDDDDIELKNDFKQSFKEICQNKYSDSAEWFMKEVEMYVEKIIAFYNK